MKKGDFAGLALIAALAGVTVFWQAWWLISGAHDEPPGPGASIWLFVSTILGGAAWAPGVSAAILAGARKRYLVFAALIVALVIGLLVTSVLTLGTRPTGVDRGGETSWNVVFWLLMNWICVLPPSAGALGVVLGLGPPKNTSQ
ncbi:MAG: hypothetical protein RKE49_03290 [Oceanicaulis sp.]